MTLLTGLVAVAAGLLIGLSLGALGSGGSILAVPVLVHLLGQSPLAATTGSLVVVGATALVAAVAAQPSGTVRVGRGLAFGAAAAGGAVVGSRLALRTPEDVLLLAFSALLLVVAVAMLVRSHRRRGLPAEQRPADLPIVTLRPFSCACPRALKVLVAATVTGLLTGFLGVGGGFLVVPALVLSLGLEVAEAAGTSLVVIVATSSVGPARPPPRRRPDARLGHRAGAHRRRRGGCPGRRPHGAPYRPPTAVAGLRGPAARRGRRLGDRRAGLTHPNRPTR